MRCYRKILHISYKDHVTNEEVCAKIQLAIGPHEDLLTIVKRCKLQWYGHVSRSSGLTKTILQGTVKRGRRQGRGRGGKTTSGNGQAWSSPGPRGQWKTGKKWRKLVVKSSVVPHRPPRLRNWWCDDKPRIPEIQLTEKLQLIWTSVNVPRIKHEDWLPCLPHKFQHCNRVKHCWIPNKTFRISHGARSLTVGDIRCNQMKPITSTWLLESDSSYCAFHQSTQYHMTVRSKTCRFGKRDIKLKAESSIEW